MPWKLQAVSRKIANQVAALRLYNITGSPKVPANGLRPVTQGGVLFAQVRRVKVTPASVETDAPEMLMGLAGTFCESLKATTIWGGLSGFAGAECSRVGI